MGHGRSARVIKLKKECREEYLEHHKAVWQEVKDALYSAGVTQYSLFLTDDNILFAYMEFKDGADYNDIIRFLSSNKKCVEWEEKMKAFQEPMEYAKEGEWWAPVKEVFRLSK